MRLLKELEKDKKDKILGLLLCALSLLLFISLLTYDPQHDDVAIRTSLASGDFSPLIAPVNNRGGVVGALVAFFLYLLLGYSSLFVPVSLLVWGAHRFSGRPTSSLRRVFFVSAWFLLAFMTLLSLPHGQMAYESGEVTFGGAAGHYLARVLLTLFGEIFSYTLVVSLIVTGLILVLPSLTINWGRKAASFLHGRISSLVAAVSVRRPGSAGSHEGQAAAGRQAKGLLDGLVRVPRGGKKSEHETASAAASGAQGRNLEGAAIAGGKQVSTSPAAEADRTPAPGKRRDGAYCQPSVDLLDDPPEREVPVDESSCRRTADTLRHTLLTFGVEIDSGEVSVLPGPVVTRFEFKPASGVKVSQIVSLADDLALAMQAKRIRIVAPVPGKPAVGVEIPNRVRRTIYIKEIISSKAFWGWQGRLPLALGKTISGEPFVADLSQMPHLLIAGATGSGKSVCLNCVIASLIYRLGPQELRFILIDPKRLELSVYDGLPHLEKAVVTEMKEAERLLADAAVEMENRYRKLARAGVRNIGDFNKKGKEILPYLVIIVDELADLMMSGLSKAESLITRLAQMARAVGIHLILATQRPSVDVITGLIKANFSSRIAFQTASKIDSRTILDVNGAEKLLGKGDMLFSSPGLAEPCRIHGAYISREETERLVQFICEQELRIKPIEAFEASESESIPGFDPASDALYKEAVELVVRHKQGSVSLLQRRLGVGYQRAARLIDQLERAGIVGPYDGSKARQVLVDESYLDSLEHRS